MSDENTQSGGSTVPPAPPVADQTPAPTQAPAPVVAQPDQPQRQMTPQELAAYQQEIDDAAAPEQGPVEHLPHAIENAKQTAECFSELEDKPKNGAPSKSDPAVISIPGNTRAWIENELLKLSVDDYNDTPQGVYWGQMIGSAENWTIPGHDWFQSCVDRTESVWEQSVHSEKGGKLTLSAPSFNDQANGLATGPRALMRIKHLLGQGTVHFVPLWHSGFWIHLKAPTEGELLELNRKISEEKISLGRQTYGMAFANSSSYFTAALMDFTMEHVYDSSYKVDNIRDIISMLDIPTLIWGMATLIWPQGFPYARSVIKQDTGQNKVIKGKLEVKKLFWTDTSYLTDYQKMHMSKRQSGAMSPIDVEKYKADFKIQGRRVELTEQISMNLRIPSVTEYLSAGQRWINGIVNMVDQAFSISPGAGSRDAYITEQGRATNMRQYAHLIEAIHAGDMTVEDTTTIEQTLDTLSALSDVRKAYFEGTKKFTEDSTFSLICVPCSEPEDKAPLPRFPHLIPIDAASVFFIQLVRKSTEIQDRP